MRIVLILICCVIIGAIGMSYLKSRHPADARRYEPTRPAPAQPESTTAHNLRADGEKLADRARDAASSAKDAIADKLADWHLTGSDIRHDLEKGGEVIRTKARAAGSTIASAASNAKVVSIIKTKYTLDKDLSARAISVSSDAGKVELTGSVANEELIGRAVALALDTDGVIEVTSHLTVAK
ncbi:MAG TPA: BON domain-containing protein [Opitutaceae bacterium]|nr:BON domain-containing protein [Opitutaceae bacterium]